LTTRATLQRVEYANGVATDFDLENGRFRVTGIQGFSGEWETPEEITRTESP